LFNRVNHGYGGKQKLGYHYAIERGYDSSLCFTATGDIHRRRLLEPVREGEAEAVFASRMPDRGSVRGGGIPSTSSLAI
jgi:hypothetical protein